MDTPEPCLSHAADNEHAVQLWVQARRKKTNERDFRWVRSSVGAAAADWVNWSAVDLAVAQTDGPPAERSAGGSS